MRAVACCVSVFFFSGCGILNGASGGDIESPFDDVIPSEGEGEEGEGEEGEGEGEPISCSNNPDCAADQRCDGNVCVDRVGCDEANAIDVDDDSLGGAATRLFLPVGIASVAILVGNFGGIDLWRGDDHDLICDLVDNHDFAVLAVDNDAVNDAGGGALVRRAAEYMEGNYSEAFQNRNVVVLTSVSTAFAAPAIGLQDAQGAPFVTRLVMLSASPDYTGVPLAVRNALADVDTLWMTSNDDISCVTPCPEAQQQYEGSDQHTFAVYEGENHGADILLNDLAAVDGGNESRADFAGFLGLGVDL